MARAGRTFFRMGPLAGMDRVVGQLITLDKNVKKKLVPFLKGEAERVLKRAKELTPVAAGKTLPYYKQGRKVTRGGGLKESGRVLTFGRTKEPKVDIVFGGKLSTKTGGVFIDYAVAVHERQDLKHAKGRSQFLLTAGKELGPSVAKNMATKIDKEVTKAVR